MSCLPTVVELQDSLDYYVETQLDPPDADLDFDTVRYQDECQPSLTQTLAESAPDTLKRKRAESPPVTAVPEPSCNWNRQPVTPTKAPSGTMSATSIRSSSLPTASQHQGATSIRSRSLPPASRHERCGPMTFRATMPLICV